MVIFQQYKREIQMSKQIDDPNQARYLRKQYKELGYDDEQQDEDNQFKKDLEKAIQNHSKHATQKNLEAQIEYFGNIIEPFNMRKEEDIGDIDNDGFFVFNKRSRAKDPWLQSIQQDEDQQIAQKIRKQIKSGGRFLSVNEKELYNNNEINNIEEAQSEQSQDVDSNKQDQMVEKQEVNKEEQQGLKVQQIIELLVSILPDNKSANQYLKKLKEEKNTEMYKKIITLCNEFIQKTGDHQILTKKKQDLIPTKEQSEESDHINWDEKQSSQEKKPQRQKRNQDEDNIF